MTNRGPGLLGSRASDDTAPAARTCSIWGLLVAQLPQTVSTYALVCGAAAQRRGSGAPWSYGAGRRYRDSVLQLLRTYLSKALYLEQCGEKQGSIRHGFCPLEASNVATLHGADIGLRTASHPSTDTTPGSTVTATCMSSAMRRENREGLAQSQEAPGTPTSPRVLPIILFTTRN